MERVQNLYRRRTDNGPDLRYNNTMSQTEILEEKVAQLTKIVDELSEVIARQDAELAVLERRVQMLMERAAEAEQGEGGGVFIAGEKPPHY